MLTEPERDVCEVCGGQTELKDYTPRTRVCLACVLTDKGQGHRIATENDKFAVHFRPFEPS